MNPLSWKQEQKTKELEWAVIDCSVEELVRFYTWRKRARYTARALGFACRYRGLDMVKALVERGADFSYSPVRLINKNGDMTNSTQIDYSVSLLRYCPNLRWNGFYKIAEQEKLAVVPLDERLRILEYLCEHAWFTYFDPNRFLLNAALSYDREMVALLKSRGAFVPDDKVNIITGRDRFAKPELSQYSNRIPDEEFISYITQINSLLGEKRLRADFGDLKPRFKSDRIPAEFLFKNFEFSNRDFNAELIKGFIDQKNIEMLDLAAKYGLLKNIELINTAIKYSTEQAAVECTAFLLDFKNRNFDIAAERKSAEKKLAFDDEFEDQS